MPKERRTDRASLPDAKRARQIHLRARGLAGMSKDLIAAIAKRYGLTPTKVTGKGASLRAEQARCEIAHRLKAEHGLTQKQIGAALNRPAKAIKAYQEAYGIQLRAFQSEALA